MSKRTPLPVTGSVIAWAIQQAGLSIEQVAVRVGVKPEVIEAWIRETDRPTKGRLRKLAQSVRRPMAVFYLPAPPVESGVPTGLRQTAGSIQRDLTAEQLRQLRRAKHLQRLMRFLIANEGSLGPDVPRLDRAMEPTAAGEVLRDWLGVPVESQLDWATAKEAFDTWRMAFEAKGVVVLQQPLGEGLRGFSLWDEYAPVVSVNSGENYQARSFTLFHEAAHLLSRTESSCAENSWNPSRRDIERWCEEVASVSLLPRAALREVASGYMRTDDDPVVVAKRVANAFKVSLRAAAIALIREGMADRSLYDEIEKRFPHYDRLKGFVRGRGGLNAPERRLAEYGERSIRLVLTALESKRLTERDARRYLRLDGAEVRDLGARIFGRAA